MALKITTPRDKQHWLELRSKNINSTEVSSLFGVNPYCTEFELWHQKKTGNIVEIEENDRMFIGSGLETAIANMAAKKMGWLIQPMKDYFEHTNYKIGASFDFNITGVTGTVLEIKNVDYLIYRDKWIENSPEDIEAPPHIELQVQTQMLVSGLSEAYLAVLVGGNDLKILHRKANKNVQDAILEAVEEFWKRETAPKIDFQRDAEFVASLHNHAEPNTVMKDPSEVIVDLVRAYKLNAEAEKEAQKQKRAIKAELLTLIGTYEKVKGDTFSISAGMRGPVEVAAHTREGFRDFRVFIKGQKDE
jgi:putative phage-type endonuclease